MTDKIIVAKFGGSSMADAAAIRRSANIALQKASSIVIVSATYGTTNQILELIDCALEKGELACDNLYQDLFAKHSKICQELELDEKARTTVFSLLNDLQALLKGISLLQDCSLKARDHVLSHGERISSILIAETLKQSQNEKEVILFDAREIIATNDAYGAAIPDIAKISLLAKEKLRPLINKNSIIVSQGFIGRNQAGITTTLGRGGSDYSASLFAEAIDADLIEIWTDVAGVASTDPRICSHAKSLKEITYKEACELATFGAKVLHPTSLWPAMRKNIPVYVGSSIEPDAVGTTIVNTSKEKPLIRAIALRRKQSLVTISTPRMVNTHGFLYNVFRIFTEHEVSVDLVTTSEISVAITLNQSMPNAQKFMAKLKEIGEVELQDGLALISLVGSDISLTPGLSKDIFTHLSDVNVRMICQGASASNICFLIDEKYAEQTVKALHKRFLES